MSLQSVVLQNRTIGFAGERIYSGGADSVDTGHAGADGLFWGLAAFRDNTALPANTRVARYLPGAVGYTLANFAGFVSRNQMNQNAAGAGHTILQGEKVDVARIAEILVVALAPIILTDTVYVILADGDPTNIGKITPTDGGANTLDISTLVELRGETTTADEVVRLSVVKK
jgi:hypothetical protein